MPSALEGLKRPDPIGKLGVVGLRCLPQTRLPYYARTPKKHPFKTIWLPTNGSNRVNNDKMQEIMHMYYSRILDDDYVKKNKPNLSSRFRFNLDQIPAEDKKKYSDQYKMPPKKWPVMPATQKAATWKTNRNSYQPFEVMGRPTCGYYFSLNADNKKRLIGIPPSNLYRWRSKNIYV